MSVLFKYNWNWKKKTFWLVNIFDLNYSYTKFGFYCAVEFIFGKILSVGSAEMIPVSVPYSDLNM